MTITPETVIAFDWIVIHPAITRAHNEIWNYVYRDAGRVLALALTERPLSIAEVTVYLNQFALDAHNAREAALASKLILPAMISPSESSNCTARVVDALFNEQDADHREAVAIIAHLLNQMLFRGPSR